MRQPKKILFPTDFSDAAERALPYAAQLARGFDAELHILHVDELHDLTERHPDAPGREEFLAALEKETGEMLDALLDDVARHAHEESPGEGLRVHRARRRGIAAGPEIIYYAQEKDIDLIVLSTHGRRGLARWVLGSVAEEVVRYTSKPVLTIPAKGEVSESTRCLVPVDFSETSQSALEAAVQICGATEGEIEVLHVVEAPIVPVIAEGYPEISIPPVEELRKAAKQQLRDFVDKVDFGDVVYTTNVLDGRPAKVIVERAAEGDFGLVVHGSHGASGFAHLLMGSVAAKVIATSRCPVLTVKHAEHEAASEEAAS